VECIENCASHLDLKRSTGADSETLALYYQTARKIPLSPFIKGGLGGILKAGATRIGQQRLRFHDALIEGSLVFGSCGGATFEERHYSSYCERSRYVPAVALFCLTRFRCEPDHGWSI